MASRESRPNRCQLGSTNHPIVSEVAVFRPLRRFRRRHHRRREDRDLTVGFARITDPKRRGSQGKDLRPIVRIVDKNGKDLNIPAPICQRNTCCHRVPWSICWMAHRWRGRRGHESAARSLETRDSPVVSRALPTCSKHVSRKILPFVQKFRLISFGKDTKASSV